VDVGVGEREPGGAVARVELAVAGVEAGSGGVAMGLDAAGASDGDGGVDAVDEHLVAQHDLVVDGGLHGAGEVA
jgi:hypothetical protein